MRKKLLFVIDSLNIGGAERSLVNLLNSLRNTDLDIDLQLFSRGGKFEASIPQNIHILPLPKLTEYLNKSLIKQLLSLGCFLSRIKFFLKIRRKSRLLNSEMQMIYWECYKQYFSNNEKEYDIAIAYSQGLPTFYVMDKTHAHKKISWLNTDIKLNNGSKEYNRQYYKRFNKIVVVSDYLKEFWTRHLYPELKDNIEVIHDIIDFSRIKVLSEEKQYDIVRDKADQHLIITVCRLDRDCKGLDLLLDTCKILADKKINFKWFIVGGGTFYEGMRRFIIENKLDSYLFLLGMRQNPYPYMKFCDIYVQTSRREGFGLTVTEAKILERPIVCTCFDGSNRQIQHDVNGLLTSFVPETIAQTICRLIDNKDLYNQIQTNLKKEIFQKEFPAKDFCNLIDKLLVN